MNTIPSLIKKYRTEQNLSLSEFGAALCKKIPGVKQSRQNIFNWESGTQKPPYYFCLLVLLTYRDYGQDWRHEWALETLRILKPELYQPDKTKTEGN